VASNQPPTVHPSAAAWPHAAQLAAAFLLGAAAALLAIRLIQGPGGRPLDLVAGPPIDLNRADRGELLQLPGIGPKLAGRIVDVRDSRGGFENADELRSVSGIGPSRIERIRPWVQGNGEARPTEPKPGGTTTTSKKVDTLAEPIDVNAAPPAELQKLPGVGPKMAQRIVDERSKRPFTSVADLRRVSGIGPKTLEKLRPFVKAGPVE
jgi:competence protein ComEA